MGGTVTPEIERLTETVREALFAHSGKWRGSKPHESPALDALTRLAHICEELTARNQFLSTEQVRADLLAHICETQQAALREIADKKFPVMTTGDFDPLEDAAAHARAALALTDGETNTSI